MEIVSSCIQPLMSCMGPPVKRQCGYLLKAEEAVKELMDLKKVVEKKELDAQSQIAADERAGKQPTEQAKLWIEKVEELSREVTTVQRDYEQRCRPNCWSSYKIGRRASKLLIKLNALENKRPDVLARDAPPASVVEQMSTTSNVVGNMITSNKKKVCGYLQEEETDGVIIGIWGMGGVGKTTLLEAINNNFLRNNGNSITNKLFDHVIFITVSKEYKPENLQKTIVKKLGLRSSEDLDSQAQIISEYLKEKNFLLLLDDMWEVVHLEDLGIPHPRSRSNSERRFRRKVVFTTRSLQVCKDMDCDERNIIKMGCLEADEAWVLFKKKVGERIINLPGISNLAKEVAGECGGLPLALVVIGRAMATKESQREWNDALTHLRKSQPSNILCTEMEKDFSMFQRLKLSYDYLPDSMKECFLCCSLWPEDYEIKKEELIMCWMGLGLIDDFEYINEVYDKGSTLIGSLTTVSLLERIQDNDDAIKMHDVIRDLALWIARDGGKKRNKWLVKAGAGLKEVPREVVANCSEAERVSLMSSGIKDLPPHLPPCPNLSILLLQKNDLTLIPGGFFTCMPNLTYLDLSSNGYIREIPKEISCLDQLRYLNLSFTNISSLPEELGELINLKYLLVRDTHLLGGVTRGIIGKLLKLEYLDLYPNGFVEIDELLSLPPSLKGIGMRITSEHALQQLSRVPVPILDLIIDIEEGDSSTTFIHLHHLLSSTCTKQSLRELTFTKFHSIRELVDVHLPRLESLHLYELENLTEIVWRRRSVVPPSECFQRLRSLNIFQCNGLKDIKWVLHLPCLEDLYLWDCKEMEQVVVIGGGGGGGEEATKPTFPSLRKLTLNRLPKLAMICDNHAAAAAVNFPSLEELHVMRCKGLKRLPFHPQLLNNCSRLKTIRGEREWWKGIEWELDQSAQSSLLQPFFKARGY